MGGGGGEFETGGLIIVGYCRGKGCVCWGSIDNKVVETLLVLLLFWTCWTHSFKSASSSSSLVFVVVFEHCLFNSLSINGVLTAIFLELEQFVLELLLAKSPFVIMLLLLLILLLLILWLEFGF